MIHPASSMIWLVHRKSQVDYKNFLENCKIYFIIIKNRWTEIKNVTNQMTPAVQKPVNTLQTTVTSNSNPTPPAGVFNAGSLTSNTFSGSFKPPDYVENIAELEEDSKISDNVRNFWEPPHTEPGVPPILTMPGVQTPNDLVKKFIYKVKSNFLQTVFI